MVFGFSLKSLFLVTTLSCLYLLFTNGCSTYSAARKNHKDETLSRYCKPQQECWPTASDWRSLETSLKGKLEIPQHPLEVCKADEKSQGCLDSKKNMKNPFFLQDTSGGTQSTGWLGAWTTSQSAYAVVAENSNDVVSALNFAKKHKLKLVIKSTGHDYLGRSNAPDSLLVWTHKMRHIQFHKKFIPKDCSNTSSGLSAFSIEAGARWLEVYSEATTKRGLYVQGGGCTSVGAAGGFLQGGGFGSWSRKYGIAAASLLEAEIVTADGKLLTANSCQNQDLFWALRGGGGGTFGIVTKVVLKTHELPKHFGFVFGSVKANSDESFKKLLGHFFNFYREKLNTENWGEQVKISGDNSISFGLTFVGMTMKEAENTWTSFRKLIEQSPKDYAIQTQFLSIPGSKMWDDKYLKKHLPQVLQTDLRQSDSPNQFWWSADAEQVSTFWYAYQSRWIPIDKFNETNIKNFVESVFQASRFWSLGFHFNKGLSGASTEAISKGKETSINPVVFNSSSLVIVAAGSNKNAHDIENNQDLVEGKVRSDKVAKAMSFIRSAVPDSGSYSNEADYFEKNWQTEFWGDNYQKLLNIKNKYDPDRVFHCHHCVGSEL